MASIWKTSKRELSFANRSIVMGILNVTPDSFTDGGDYLSPDKALRRVEVMVAEGADIIDIGGESTRPGSRPVATEEEVRRTVPIIQAIVKRFDLPISIDTSKSEVARRAIDAGAEIINDISGLRFDEQIAVVAADSNAGLVLMHSRGSFETMHTQPPVTNILSEVTKDLRRAIALAKAFGVAKTQIAIDIGLGFGKTFEQNLELLAKLDKIIDEFKAFPMLVGASRKSFIGTILGDVPTGERLDGSIAVALTATTKGAKIVRVHDVKETVAALKDAAARSN